MGGGDIAEELFYGKRYSATCLRRRPSCPGGCKGPNDQCPEYVMKKSLADFLLGLQDWEETGMDADLCSGFVART